MGRKTRCGKCRTVWHIAAPTRQPEPVPDPLPGPDGDEAVGGDELQAFETGFSRDADAAVAAGATAAAFNVRGQDDADADAVEDAVTER